MFSQVSVILLGGDRVYPIQVLSGILSWLGVGYILSGGGGHILYRE